MKGGQAQMHREPRKGKAQKRCSNERNMHKALCRLQLGRKNAALETIALGSNWCGEYFVDCYCMLLYDLSKLNTFKVDASILGVSVV